MKTLVYGIDGMSAEILRTASPEFGEYLSTLTIHDIEDDILGRGWTKIFSGQPPQVTNAYFQMPVADGSYKIDKNYSLNTPGAAANGRFEYLWDVAERLGQRAVFVNMPTASPAPPKGAAFISGIGGGRYPKDGFDDDLYFPEDIKSVIDAKYKIDARLNPKYGDIENFCTTLNDIHRAQSDVFIELCEMKKADLGFFINKVTVELLFLAYFDVINIKNADKVVAKAIEGHFKTFYHDFNGMVDRLKPERVILVSDHGTAPYKFDFNIDLLLEKLGLLKFAQDGAKKRAKKVVGKFLPSAVKSRVKANLNLQNKRFPLQTPTASSLAFGTVFDTGNFAGIFLNDERFGGQTPSGDKAAVEKICTALNGTAEFEVLGLKAEPYAPRDMDTPHAYLSPDIRICKPDEVFCQRRDGAILQVNPNFKGITPDITGYSYPNSGVKSSYALLASNFAPRTRPTSLCDAHTLIVQAMEQTAA